MVTHGCTLASTADPVTELAKYVTAAQTPAMAAGQPGCCWYFLVGKLTFLLLIFTPVSILGEIVTRSLVFHVKVYLIDIEMWYC